MRFEISEELKEYVNDSDYDRETKDFIIQALRLELQRDKLNAKHYTKDYDELICVDLLCHGVPSNKVFKDYVRYLEDKHHGKLVSINFRDKEKNGWSITLSYDISRRKKLIMNSPSSGSCPFLPPRHP